MVFAGRQEPEGRHVVALRRNDNGRQQLDVVDRLSGHLQRQAPRRQRRRCFPDVARQQGQGHASVRLWPRDTSVANRKMAGSADP